MDDRMRVDPSNPSPDSDVSIYNRVGQTHLEDRPHTPTTERQTISNAHSYLALLHEKGFAEDLNRTKVTERFDAKPSLISSFQEACRTQKFDDFMRVWKETRSPGIIPKAGSRSRQPPYPSWLRKAFRKDFVGKAAEALVEYLTEANRMFHGEEGGTYYAKILPIVQASGTGKSRMILELFTHKVLVVYVCLRDPTDVTSYPPRDAIIADILDLRSASPNEYLIRYYLVLGALFKTIQDWIPKVTDDGWGGLLGLDATCKREAFFSDIEDSYNAMAVAPVSSDLTVAAAHARRRMRTDYASMISAFSKRFERKSSDEPQIVIAFDEAHTLNKDAALPLKPSYYLCRALSDLKLQPEESVWALFASTDPRISHLAAPAVPYDSPHVAQGGHRIITPFTLTGWDQFAPSVASPGVSDIDQVSRFEQLKRFGRPLWNGLDEEDAMFSAEEKLVHSNYFSAKNDMQALAVLGQRFALDVAFGLSGALEFLDLAIASHLRICFSVTDDNLWRFTSYPSEPVLSSVAASFLHKNPANIVECLRVLNSKVHSGMIDKGQCGELVSRVLLQLGRDYTCKQSPGDRTTLPYCHPVKVLDYLKTTFGPHFEDPSIQKAFQHAYVNFSHWVSMKENLVRPKSDTSEDANLLNNKHFGSKRFLLSLWLRTAAIQCAHSQPDADKVAPIYFNMPEVFDCEDRLAPLLVSDKLREHDRTTVHENLGPSKRLKTDLPSISVTCDMGLTSSQPDVVFENNVLSIHVKGVSRKSFPFTTKEVEKEMMKLVSEVKHSVPRYPIGAEVAKKFEFGRNTLPSYTSWE